MTKNHDPSRVAKLAAALGIDSLGARAKAKVRDLIRRPKQAVVHELLHDIHLPSGTKFGSNSISLGDGGDDEDVIVFGTQYAPNAAGKFGADLSSGKLIGYDGTGTRAIGWGDDIAGQAAALGTPGKQGQTIRWDSTNSQFVNAYGDNGQFVVGDSVAQVFTVDFTGQTKAALDGDYFIAYDADGSVAVWFDGTNGTAEPAHGADRAIEINAHAAATDDATGLVAQFVTDLGVDSKFSVVDNDPLGTVTQADSGVLGDPSATNTTGMTISVTTQGDGPYPYSTIEAAGTAIAALGLGEFDLAETIWVNGPHTEGGAIDIDEALTISGAARDTMVDMGSSTLTISATAGDGRQVVIENLTFLWSGGTVTGFTFTGTGASTSPVVFRNCRFLSAGATLNYSAGASSNAQVTFEDCYFAGNDMDFSGGGVSVTFDRCRIETSTYTGSSSGTVFRRCTGTASVTVTGGLTVEESSLATSITHSGTDMNVRRSTITASSGSAAVVSTSGAVNFHNSLVIGSTVAAIDLTGSTGVETHEIEGTTFRIATASVDAIDTDTAGGLQTFQMNGNIFDLNGGSQFNGTENTHWAVTYLDGRISAYALQGVNISTTAPTDNYVMVYDAGTDTWGPEAGAAPGVHASSHISGAGDEIDGDRIDIDYTPTNYTQDVTPGEVTLTAELTAHLAGIDNALAAANAETLETVMTNQTDTAFEAPNSISVDLKAGLSNYAWEFISDPGFGATTLFRVDAAGGLGTLTNSDVLVNDLVASIALRSENEIHAGEGNSIQLSILTTGNDVTPIGGVAETAAVIETGDAGTNTNNNLLIRTDVTGADEGEIHFLDKNLDGSGWTRATIPISSTTTEYDDYAAIYGEVSLLSAHVQAGVATTGANVKVVYMVIDDAHDSAWGNYNSDAGSTSTTIVFSNGTDSETVNGITIDATFVGTRFLFPLEQNGALGKDQNGIYELTSITGAGPYIWTFTRVSDFDSDAEIARGTLISVENVGANNWDETLWSVNRPDSFTLGTTAINIQPMPYGNSLTRTSFNGLGSVSQTEFDGNYELRLDLNDLAAAAIDVAADTFAFTDTSDSNATRKESIADLVSAMAGSGLSATSGVLSADLSGISAAVFDPAADSAVFIDATDSGTKQDAWSDVATAVAGTGLAASAGVISVDFSTAFNDTKAVAAADLNSTTTGEGASIIGIEDASAYYTGTDVEAALNEIEAQIGGATSSTFAFTEDNVLADNDAVYAALDKLDLKWGDLASTANGEGASLVGIEDSGGLITATDVEGALAENRTAIDAIEDNTITAGAGITSTGTVGADDQNIAINEASATVTITGGTWTFPTDNLQVTGTPDSANDAVNKSYVDSQLSGITWKEPVCVADFIGERTIAQIDALTPSEGWAVVATDAGTPAAGTSDALVAGDLAEYNGTSWIKLYDADTGSLAAGLRLIASETATLFSPLTDATDDGKILTSVASGGTITGTNSDFTDSGDAADGNAVLVQCDEGAAAESTFENNGYVFDGAVPTGTWVQFTGAGQLNAGAGLSKTGNTLNIGDVNKGVQANTDDLQIDASEIADFGLEQVPGGGNEHLIRVDVDAAFTGANAWQGNHEFDGTVDFGANMTMSGDFDFTPTTDANGELGTDALRWKRIRGQQVVSGDHDFLVEERNAHITVTEEPEGLFAYNWKNDQVYDLTTMLAEPELADRIRDRLFNDPLRQDQLAAAE